MYSLQRTSASSEGGGDCVRSCTDRQCYGTSPVYWWGEQPGTWNCPPSQCPPLTGVQALTPVHKVHDWPVLQLIPLRHTAHDGWFIRELLQMTTVHVVVSQLIVSSNWLQIFRGKMHRFFFAIVALKCSIWAYNGITFDLQSCRNSSSPEGEIERTFIQFPLWLLLPKYCQVVFSVLEIQTFDAQRQNSCINVFVELFCEQQTDHWAHVDM